MPDNAGDEDCVVMSSIKRWNDVPCTSRAYVLCESDIDQFLGCQTLANATITTQLVAADQSKYWLESGEYLTYECVGQMTMSCPHVNYSAAQEMVTTCLGLNIWSHEVFECCPPNTCKFKFNNNYVSPL